MYKFLLRLSVFVLPPDAKAFKNAYEEAQKAMKELGGADSQKAPPMAPKAAEDKSEGVEQDLAKLTVKEDEKK